MTTIDTYNNTLVYIPVLIANGDTTSSIINQADMSIDGAIGNVRGYANLQSIFVLANFPAGTVTFNISLDGTSENLGSHQVCDGINQLSPSLTFSGSEITNITMPPFWFNAVQYIQIVSSAPMTVDTTIYLGFQPLYQGVA